MRKIKNRARKPITAISLAAIVIVSSLIVIPSVSAVTNNQFNYLITASGTSPEYEYAYSASLCYNCFGTDSWECPDHSSEGWSAIAMTRLPYPGSDDDYGCGCPTGLYPSYPGIVGWQDDTTAYYCTYRRATGTTSTEPWSATETGTASVSSAEGNKYILTSSLEAPNHDTIWSVSDDSALVDTWMDGPKLYARAINHPPIADANGLYAGYEGSAITFNASNSTDSDGDELHFRWDFDNDGTWDTEWSTSSTASYTWDDDWSGTVKLEVTDGEFTDSDTASVTVNNVAPTVDAGDDPYVRFTTDSTTYEIVLPWRDYPMSADSHDIDLLVELQTWYEAAHQFTRGPAPAMITEYEYSMLDSQDQEPIGGSAGSTWFAFPIAENDCHDGLGEFENEEGEPAWSNVVSLSYVDGAVVSYGMTTDGTIRIEMTYFLTPGETVQFMDHKLMFDSLSTANGDYAMVTLWYCGNVEDDNQKSVQVGTDETWFDRHNFGFEDQSHPARTWYARLDTYGPAYDFAEITIGKELRAGDTFYVRGVRYDISEIRVTDSNGDGKADKLWSVTLSAPLPQGEGELVDDGLISSQRITQFAMNAIVPVLPPYNERYCVPAPSINEGDTVSFSGSFSDPGSGDTHTITWDFGDGGSASDTLTPSHVYGDNGVYTVTLTVADDDGGVGSDSLLVTVNNVAPTVDAGADQTVDEGDIVGFSGSFSDPGWLDTHTITWDFGDGGSASDTLTPSHVYGDNGVYTVTLTVADDDGGSNSDTLTVTVNNVAPTVDAGADQTVDEGDTVGFSGSFSDPGSSDTHTITWDFGDGGSASDTLTPSHVYGDNGVYTVTLTVTDDDGGTTSDTRTVTVNNVAPTADFGNDGPKDEGSAVMVSFSNQNDPGTSDTFTYSFDWDNDGTYDVVDQSGASAQRTWGDEGTYTVKGMIKDNDGGYTEYTTDVTVNNVAPTASLDSIVQPNPTFILPVVHTLTFTGSFTDPGWLDTHTTSWNFGDGTVLSGTLNEENDEPEATGTTSAEHAYSGPGSYTITLIVTDDEASGADTATVTVISADGAPEVIDDYIQNLPDDAFKKPADQHKNTFGNKLSSIDKLISAGDYQEAIDKLRYDIRAKADGSVDGNPNDDWITDPIAQQEICKMIDDLIAYLETLL